MVELDANEDAELVDADRFDNCGDVVGLVTRVGALNALRVDGGSWLDVGASCWFPDVVAP